jgi:hypothetical protein
MGGERETTAPQRVEKETGPEIIGSVRYHESKSQIHFHDDDNKLKVAIPVAAWYKAWNNLLSSLPNEWHYADVDNGTALHVTLTLKKANQKKGREHPRLDALLHIEKIEPSEEFAKLHKFSVK